LAAGPPSGVVIDEIQPLPPLLNEVHRLIEQRGVRFLLTGSRSGRIATLLTPCGPANLAGDKAFRG
jgi:hypothetical protein